MSGFLFPTSRDRDYEVSKFDTLVTGAVDLPAKSVSGFKFDCRDSGYCHYPSRQASCTDVQDA